MKLKEDLINYLNGLNYEQYNALWCKALCFSCDTLYGWEGGYINGSDYNEQEVIESFIKKNMIYITPERHMLFYDKWHRIERSVAVDIADQLINESNKGIEKQREEADSEIRRIFGDEVADNVSTLSEEKKREIDWEEFCENWGLELSGEPILDFTDYPKLKQVFFEELFDPETIRFYTNVEDGHRSNLTNTLKDTPSVIAMDKSVIGIMWFEK